MVFGDRLVPYTLAMFSVLESVTHGNVCCNCDFHTKGGAVLSDLPLLQIPGHFQPTDGHSG